MKKYDIQKDGEFEIVSKSYDYIMEDVTSIVQDKAVLIEIETDEDGNETEIEKEIFTDREVITPTEKRTSGTLLQRINPNTDLTITQGKDAIEVYSQEIRDFAKKTYTPALKKAYLAKIKPSDEQVKLEAKEALKSKYKSDLEKITVEVNGNVFDVAMSSAIAYATTIKHLPDGGKTYWTLANKKLVEVTKEELIEVQGLGEIEGLRLGGLYHLEKSKV